MKHVVVTTLLLCLASSFVLNQTRSAATDKQSKDEQAISRLLDEQREALLRGDADAMSRSMADDLIGVNGFGGLYDKAGAMKSFPGKPRTVAEEGKEDERIIRVFGETAVAVRLLSGPQGENPVRVMHVFARRGGK